MIKPQIIESEGKPAFVVLPYADWLTMQELAEDAEDNAALAAFHANPTELFPVSVVDAMIAGEHPVRVYRNYRGLTLRALADASGITVPYLSQIETGKRNPSTDVLKKIADALGFAMDDLV
jgi:DNA-binding XRE family transcriptional regulator